MYKVPAIGRNTNAEREIVFIEKKNRTEKIKERLIETKNKFSLLKDKVAKTTIQESRPKVVGLVTEKGRAT